MHIQFKSFQVQKAFTYKDVSINLANQGTVLVKGLNLDTDKRGSNGSGKSAIWECLAHTLYATTGRGLRKSDILTEWDPTNYRTHLVFDREGEEYQVEQYREHDELGTGVRIFKGGQLITDGLHANQAQEEVAKQLGITHDEFFGVVYLHQDAQHVLVSGKPSQRKEYLTTVFPQLQVFDDLYDHIGKRSATKLIVPIVQLQESLSELVVQLADKRFEQLSQISSYADLKVKATNQQEVAQVELEAAIHRVAQARQGEQARETWQKYLKAYHSGAEIDLLTIEGPLAQVPKLQSQIEILERDWKTYARFAQVSKSRTTLEAWLFHHQLEATVDSLQIQLQILEDKKEILSVKMSIGAEILRLKALLPATASDAITLEELQQVLATTRTSIADAQAVIDSAGKTLSNLSGSERICPVCKKPLSEEEAKALITSQQIETDSKTKMLQLLAQDLINGQAEEQRLQGYQVIEQQLAQWTIKWQDQFSSDIVDLNQAQEDLQDIQTQTKICLDDLAVLKQVEIKRKELDILEAVPEGLEGLQQINVVELEKLRTQKSVLDGIIALAPYLDSPTLVLAESLEKQHRETRDVCKQSVENTTEMLRELQTLEFEQKDLQRRQQEKEVEIRAGQAIANTDTCVKYLKMTYRRMRDIQCTEVLQSLRQVLPMYTDLFFASKDLKITVSEEEGLPALLMERHGKLMDPRKLSGGQRKRISVSALLSISDIKRGTKEINLQIFDEIFGALDDPGREAAVYILQERRSKCESIFVITHEQEVLGAQWDQVWWAVLKNDESRIVRLDTTDPAEVALHVA